MAVCSSLRLYTPICTHVRSVRACLRVSNEAPGYAGSGPAGGRVGICWGSGAVDGRNLA